MAEGRIDYDDLLWSYNGVGTGLNEDELRRIGQAMTFQRTWGKQDKAVLSGEMKDENGLLEAARNLYIPIRCSEKGTTSYVSGIELDSCKRQAAEQLSYADMPEGMNVSDRFPAMDPEGKFCDVDMGFAQRLQLVEGLVKGRGEEVQTYVSQVLQDMDYKKPNNQSALGKMSRQMKDDCKQVRMYERATKIATNSFQNEEAAQILGERAKEAARSKSVMDYENALTAMEHLCGIKQGPVPQELQTYMGQMGRPMNETLINEGMKPDAETKILPITFNNLGNQLRQNYFSRPGHWNLPVPSAEKLDAGLAQYAAKGPKQKAAVEQTMDTITEHYAGKTVGMMLDAKFQAYEDKFDLHSAGSMNRERLITINGKRVCDLMREEYDKSPELKGKYESFHDWHAANGKDFTNQHVAAALMGGARVEAFLPDEKGNIKEPTEITRTGYSPSPVEKVTMNHWQRTWAKFGHYKELAAKRELYKNTMESREIIRKEAIYAQGSKSRSPYSTIQFKNFLGSQDRDKLLPTSRFKEPARGGAATTAMCMLLGQGKTLREMADFDCLKEEKLAAGAEYMKHYARDVQAEKEWYTLRENATMEERRTTYKTRPANKDTKWLGEQLVKGQVAAIKELEQLGREGKLCDPKWLRENQQFVKTAQEILHDSSQNCDVIPEDYGKAAAKFFPNEKDPKKYLQDKFGPYVDYFKAIEAGFQAETIQSDRPLEVWEAVVNVATKDWVMRETAVKFQQNPDKPFGEMLKEDMNLCDSNVNGVTGLMRKYSKKYPLKNEMEANPQMVETFKQYCHMGKLDKLLKLDLKLEQNNPEIVDLKVGINKKFEKHAMKKVDNLHKVSESLQKGKEKEEKKAQQSKNPKPAHKPKEAPKAGGRTR